MKRKVAMAVLIAMLAVTCMSMTCACERYEYIPPKEVEIEVLNPHTGEPIKYMETIEMPEDNTPLVVKFKVKETGEYLTNVDLPGQLLLKDCVNIAFFVLDNKGNTIRSWRIDDFWPTKEELEKYPLSKYNYYKIRVSFECEPVEVDKSGQPIREYATITDYCRFYINKEKE